MTKFIYVSAAVAALLATTNATPFFPYASNLPCQQCIVSGYDYCINGTTDGITPKPLAYQCYQQPFNPEISIPDGTGIRNGYVCSRGVDTNLAIVVGCGVEAAQDSAVCGGEYGIDLSKSGETEVRFIQKLPVGQSCTYRIHSKCGYPTANINIHNPVIAGDFYIQYGADSTLAYADDLGWDWDLNESTEWNGNFQTASTNAVDYLSAGYASSATKVADDEFAKCSSKDRNLWVTVVRVKNSTKAVEEESFLAATPRQLQLLFNDVQLVFGSIQGPSNARVLSAISFALVALLSVFAF